MDSKSVLVEVEVEQGLCEACGQWVDVVDHSLSHLALEFDLRTLDHHRVHFREPPCRGWFKKTRTITRQDFAQPAPTLRIVRHDR